TAPLTAPVLRWTANAPCAVPSWRLYRPSGFPKNIDSPDQFCKLHLFLLVSGMSSKRNTRVTEKVRTNLPDSLKHNCRFGAGARLGRGAGQTAQTAASGSVGCRKRKRWIMIT